MKVSFWVLVQGSSEGFFTSGTSQLILPVTAEAAGEELTQIEVTTAFSKAYPKYNSHRVVGIVNLKPLKSLPVKAEEKTLEDGSANV